MQYICYCCFDFGSNTIPNPPEQSAKKKPNSRSAVQTRLQTKHKQQDFLQISQQDRKTKKVVAYCCPICTNYFNKILACNQCVNFICFSCMRNYDEKNVEFKKKMKCPFCTSVKSLFLDYQLEPHSYFDTTNKGFLGKEERAKLDQQFIKPAENQIKMVIPLQNIFEHRQQ